MPISYIQLHLLCKLILLIIFGVFIIESFKYAFSTSYPKLKKAFRRYRKVSNQLEAQRELFYQPLFKFFYVQTFIEFLNGFAETSLATYLQRSL